MKVFDLLHSLTIAEKKQLDAVMKKHKRKRVVSLYNYIRKTPRHQLNNRRLYELLFNDKYSAGKDYKLRNELRLLSDVLKEFLVDAEMQYALKQNRHVFDRWYLQALKRRNLPELYDKEYPKMYPKALEALQFETCMNMSLIHVDHVAETWSVHLDYNLIWDAMQALNRDIKRFTTFQLLENDRTHALLHKLSKIVSNVKHDRLPPFNDVKESFLLDIDNDYALAVKNLTLAHNAIGKEQLNLLMEALECIQKLDHPGIPQRRLLTACYNSIGIYHTVNGSDKELVIKYMRLAFEQVHPDGYNAVVIFSNYLRTLSRYGLHDKAADVFESCHHHYKNEEQYPILLTAFLETEVLYGSVERVMMLLPGLDTRKPINYRMYKVLLATAYFKQQLYQLALTEMNNVLQQIRETDDNDDYLKLLLMMKQYIRCIENPRSKGNLQKLRTSVSDLETAYTKSVLPRMTLLNWYYNQSLELLEEHDAM